APLIAPEEPETPRPQDSEDASAPQQPETATEGAPPESAADAGGPEAAETAADLETAEPAAAAADLETAEPVAAAADLEATEPVAAAEGLEAAEPTAAAQDPVPVDETALLGGEMVTETLADLYLSQGLAERAATLYRQLLIRRPGDPRLLERLEQALARAPRQSGQHGCAQGEGPQPGRPADEAGAAASAPEPVVAARPDGGVGDEPVFEELDPERLTEVEAAWTGGEAAGTESVSPYTWQEEAAPAVSDGEAEPTIRAYFERLMDWEAGE